MFKSVKFEDEGWPRLHTQLLNRFWTETTLTAWFKGGWSTHRKLDPALKENIVGFYLKSDSLFSESLQRDRNTKSLKVKLRSQTWLQMLSEHKPTRTRRPEASQTSPSGMSSTIQVHQVTHMRVSRDLRGELLTRKQRGSSPWHFWSNSPSRSGIFYLYYCSNTLCKCNMKSTITQRTDTSLWSPLS